MRIINIVGARPNFMKIAPIMRAYRAHPNIEPILLHTGQHYDAQMSDQFFEQLQIPTPDINLEVGSGSHAQQTAQIMTRFEPVCLEHKPDLVLVLGDVNSTIACSLVAAKLQIPIAHVEAGLRSFDRSMPEEINRVLTDALSQWLFVTEPSGVSNLLREGIPQHNIHLVGNVMIDTLLSHRASSDASPILHTLSLSPQSYAVVTLHRPSNVDHPHTLQPLINALLRIANDGLTLALPLHPRTLKNLQSFHLLPLLQQHPNIRLSPPLGYLDFLKLTANARLVLTDSGGIQEETTILKVPCVTLRDNTERPITCDCGGNLLVGSNPDRIFSAYQQALSISPSSIQTPPLWDGLAAQRITSLLANAPSPTPPPPPPPSSAA